MFFKKDFTDSVKADFDAYCDVQSNFKTAMTTICGEEFHDIDGEIVYAVPYSDGDKTNDDLSARTDTLLDFEKRTLDMWVAVQSSEDRPLKGAFKTLYEMAPNRCKICNNKYIARNIPFDDILLSNDKDMEGVREAIMSMTSDPKVAVLILQHHAALGEFTTTASFKAK